MRYSSSLGNAGTNAAAYTIYPQLTFSPDSFAPIAVVAKTFGIVALRKDFPAKNLQEYVAYARSHPGRLNYASLGRPTDLESLLGNGWRIGGLSKIERTDVDGSAPRYDNGQDILQLDGKELLACSDSSATDPWTGGYPSDYRTTNASASCSGRRSRARGSSRCAAPAPTSSCSITRRCRRWRTWNSPIG